MWPKRFVNVVQKTLGLLIRTLDAALLQTE